MSKEVMKLALEALEAERDNYQDWDEKDGAPEYIYEAIAALREAMAEQPAQQEPVAWMYTSHWKGDERFITRYQSELMTYKADKVWPLYTNPSPCPTCEALARTVMLDQTSHDQFKPDWDTQAVLVEEQQRMAKRILELEALLERQTALLERQTARIVDLQTHINNLEGEE